MWILLIYLTIIPILMGIGLGYKRGLAEIYLKGSLAILGVFSLCYYVVLLVLHSTSMVRMAQAFQMAMIPLLLLGVVRLVLGRRELAVMLENVGKCLMVNRGWMILALVLVAFHILRVGLMQPFELSDSQTYDALVHDMAQTGVIYGQAPRTGQIWYILSKADPRYVMTSWYVYEAYLSRMTGVHALILSETIVPMVIIGLSYLTLWLMSGVLFDDHLEKRWIFLFLCGMAYEAQLVAQDAAAYMLVWPAWGKNLVASIICPLMAVVFMELVLERRGWITVAAELMLCSFLAANASMSAMVAIPVELGALCLVYTIGKRRSQYMGVGVLSMIPIGVQFVLYKLFTAGLLFS